MKRTALACVLALFVGVACWPFDGEEQLNPMTLKRESGEVFVLRGGERIDVADEVPLQPADEVHTLEGGSAKLRLEGDRLVEVAGLSQVRIIDSGAVEGQEGSVLIEAGDLTRVRFDEVEAEARESVFRIDRGLGFTRAGTYEGEVSYRAPGQARVPVGSLFQVSVAANDIQRAKPYELDHDDRWDKFHLASIVDLDEEFERLSRTLQRRLAGQRPGLPYFRELAGRGVGFLRPFLSRRPPDLLIGFTIARNTPEMRLRGAFVEAFTLFDEGARWGIVGGILQSRPKAVVAQLENVILATGALAAGAGGEEPGFTAAAAQASDTGTTTAGSTGGSGTGGSGGGGSGGGGSGGGGSGGGGSGGNGEEPSCEGNAVECLLEDAGVPGPSPSP